MLGTSGENSSDHKVSARNGKQHTKEMRRNVCPDLYYDQTDYQAMELDRNYGRLVSMLENRGGLFI